VLEDQKHDQPQPGSGVLPQLNSVDPRERRSARERVIPRKMDMGGGHGQRPSLARPHAQPDAVEPKLEVAANQQTFLISNDDDAPDMSMYVKRMSLTDGNGCSSGQVGCPYPRPKRARDVTRQKPRREKNAAEACEWPLGV
jgi:hypothetical protein